MYAFRTWTGTNLLSLSTEQRINFNFTLSSWMLTTRKITDICSWQLCHVCSPTLWIIISSYILQAEKTQQLLQTISESNNYALLLSNNDGCSHYWLKVLHAPSILDQTIRVRPSVLESHHCFYDINFSIRAECNMPLSYVYYFEYACFVELLHYTPAPVFNKFIFMNKITLKMLAIQ